MKHEAATAAKPFGDHIYDLSISTDSVSAILAKDPSLAPGDAWNKLYKHHVKGSGSSHDADNAGKGDVTREQLERAAKCGKWGPTQPSDLFLRIYHDALAALDDDPARALVSPSLMGSCGVLPLTILSVIPDIARHVSNVIARAEREVFLATYFWQDGAATKYITDGLRELSRRAGERGVKVVVKIVYDRTSPVQFVAPHYEVKEKDYTGKNVKLPPPSEIPYIDLQVMNYHQPVMGSFHCKYAVVDRKIAILQSNNTQDNDNMEMMCHLEGPIVDSFYDMALISWSKKLNPPLPSHNSPAVEGGLGSFGDKHEAIFGPEGTIKGHSVVIDPKKMPPRELYGYERGPVKKPGIVNGQDGQVESDNPHRADILTGPTTTQSTTHPHPQHNTTRVEGTSTDQTPVVSASTIDASTANQKATTGPGSSLHSPPENRPSEVDAQTSSLLNSGEQPVSQAQISHPAANKNADPIPEFTGDDPHFDDDIAGEVARVQYSVSAKPGETHIQAVTRHLNHTTNVGFKGNAPECAPEVEMTPYLPHRTHEPFPIAMLNRSPYGPPNRKGVLQPQNIAWLSAMRNATKNVFIQTPTLNAEPLLPAIYEACERGIDVFCYVCLGYNDAGELLPMQGGHNEMIAHKLYTNLSPAAKQRLHYFWYVAKDQTKPIIQEKRKRSCHVKLMIVDEHIGIMGSGNQDTQSWYHSQEVNVMLDNAEVCRVWIDGLRRNQNTHIYGALDKEEGVWRDKDGKQADGCIGFDAGKFAWARGIVGAVHKASGGGGF